MKRIFQIVVAFFLLSMILQVKAGPLFPQQRKDLLLKSDSLFGKGVELYRQGSYMDAVPFFVLSDSIDKAELDSTDNRRDYSAIWLASCYYKLGDTLKAQSVHDYYRFVPVDRRLTVQSDSLSALGMSYFAQGDYSKALDCFLACGEIEKSVVGDGYILGNTVDKIANCYYNLKDTSNALIYKKKYTDIVLSCFGEYTISYIIGISRYASMCSLYSQHVRAVKYYKRAYQLADSLKLVGLADSCLYKIGNEYNKLGILRAEKFNYSEAIYWETKAINIYKKVLGVKHPDYATSLNNLGVYYYNGGNYSEALRFGTEAMAIRKEVLGEKHPDYAKSLNELATYYYSLGNYVKALQFGTEAMVIRKEVLGEKHPDYMVSLNNLAIFLSCIGNYTEAIRLEKELINYSKEILGEKHPEYVKSLGNLALFYNYVGDYNEAIKLEMKVIDIKKEILGEKHPDYIISLTNLASYKALVGNYNEAIILGTKVTSLWKEMQGDNHENYLTSLTNLASYKLLAGYYTEAISLEIEALNIKRKLFGERHPVYVQSLNNIAIFYASLGDYSEALRFGEEALAIRKEVLGERHPDYAQSLNNIAIFYASLGDYSEALRFGEEALAIQKEVLGERHPDYAQSLNNIAFFYASLGDYSEALRFGEEALAIRKEVLGERHPKYAISLHNLAAYLFEIGRNYNEVIRLETEVLNIRKEILGEKHPDYAISLFYLANYYMSAGRLFNASALFQKVTGLFTDLILSNFGNLTTSSQTLFWDKYNNYFNNELPFLTYKIPTDSMRISAYNGILFSKGLLLNAELEMKKLLQESGDSAIIALYDDVQMNKILFGKMLEKPIKERFFDVDSLQQVIQEQEQELIQRSKTYGDYTRNLRIDWKDVQVKLGHEDIALEFLSFPNENGNVMYAVLVLKPGMDCPDIVPLFEEKQLMQIPVYEYYNTTELYRLVWQPLEEKLKGVRNVYFAPAGELYNIAIETLPDSDSTWIFNHFDLHRLSSTRQLAYIQDKYSNNGARIYGGLKYDTDLAQLINDNNKYMTEENRYTRSFDGNFIADSLHMRNGAAELPGTRIEAENIKRTLDMAHVENDLLTDSIGTESSFKAMSGKRIRALHIATHGFYWTEKEASQKKNMEFLLLDDNQNPKYKEDKSLTRSGLLMAGANNALMGVDIPDNVDNGILTAKEIAGLDLRGMDMVVLSACQTGLGEITNEGVFGLQRGFKKAGAKSLLMSLWKVDDRATQLLMTHFYTNLLAGMGKHKALIEAQRFVREYEEERVVIVNEMTPSQKRRMEKQGIIWKEQTEIRKERPYSHPKYWAAFILLDGIDAD